MQYGLSSLLQNKKIVNDLNVFPIPDGDTGENMYLTLQGGVRAIKDLKESSVATVARIASDGMLNAARGNSGVILSQLFDGFANGITNKDTIVLADLVIAFESATKQGYSAVDQPTEGTILTVVRETTESLKALDLSKMSALDFVDQLLQIVKKSVEATPDKLQKLKDNGVVDSGGAGLYYIFEGCAKYLRGENIEITSSKIADTSEVDYHKFNENSVLEFGYCSEVLLQLTKHKCDIDKFDLNALKDFLNSIGDSLVVVQNGYTIKVHVHTFEPYKLLEYCGRFGEFLKVKVENMTLQHSETQIQNNFAPKTVENKQRKKYGVVAVANGAGVKSVFKEFGADVVIDGGQTNNPSSSDFIQAYTEANAEIIFVFANNSNVILAAKQAADKYKAAKIHIIKTRNIGEGYAGLSMSDFTVEDDSAIVENIESEIKNARTGAITVASRTTVCNGLSINEGDYIGLVDENIVTVHALKPRVVINLLDQMQPEQKVCVTLMYGKNFSSKEKEFAKNYLATKYPDLEVYEIDGGQEIYDLYVVMN